MHLMAQATRSRVAIADISFGLQGRGLEGRGWFLRRPRESRTAYLARVHRAGCCIAKVVRYSKIMIVGKDFTPPLLFKQEDGRITVDDGAHRICAAVLAGTDSLEAVVVPASDELSRLMFDLEYYGAQPYAALAKMAAMNMREVAHV